MEIMIVIQINGGAHVIMYWSV